MKIGQVKGIVWDLDGTLIDSFGIFEKILLEVVEESGHAMPSEEELRLNYHGSLEATIKKTLGLNNTDELNAIVDSFLAKQEKHYEGNLDPHLFEDASWFARVAAEKKIKQLVVTNRFHKNRGNASPRSIIAATVLADYIHEVRPGDEDDFRKPDKRSVLDWLEKHNIEVGELLVIGDQFIDAQLAINLGARIILVRRNGDIPHLSALDKNNSVDIIIVDSLKEIDLI
jgi:phosphoglycolate phosphatase-like HAD superfamily hydrolase